MSVSSYAMNDDDVVENLERLKEYALACTPPQVRRIDETIQSVSQKPHDGEVLLWAAGQLALIGLNHDAGDAFTDRQMIEYMRQVTVDLCDRAAQAIARENQKN